MPKTKAAKKTGSQKLAAKHGDAGASSALARALATLNKNGIINDILVRGTPHPNIIKGTITAKSAAQVGSALNTLVKIKDIQFKPLKLFPKGIPIIDEIVVQIDGKIRT